MNLTVIQAIVIISAIGGLVLLFYRRRSEFAVIDTESILKERESKKKRQIVSTRLKRKVFEQGNKAYEKAAPLFAGFKAVFTDLYKKLKDLEAEYRIKNKPKDLIANKKRQEETGKEAKELISREDYDEAEKRYIELISLDKENTAAYKELAELYLLKKDYEHAKEIYKFLLKLNKEDDFAYSQLGQINKGLGDYESAEADYLRSVQINSKVACYHIELGEIYQAQSQPEKAQVQFLQALELEPNNPKNLDIIIENSIILKDKDCAEKFFKQLQRVNTENKKLDDFRKRIKEM